MDYRVDSNARQPFPSTHAHHTQQRALHQHGPRVVSGVHTYATHNTAMQRSLTHHHRLTHNHTDRCREKAAAALKGVVTVGAVDGSVSQQLMQKYGVRVRTS